MHYARDASHPRQQSLRMSRCYEDVCPGGHGCGFTIQCGLTIKLTGAPPPAPAKHETRAGASG
jgi:hypothetical protein